MAAEYILFWESHRGLILLVDCSRADTDAYLDLAGSMIAPGPDFHSCRRPTQINNGTRGKQLAPHFVLEQCEQRRAVSAVVENIVPAIAEMPNGCEHDLAFNNHLVSHTTTDTKHPITC